MKPTLVLQNHLASWSPEEDGRPLFYPAEIAAASEQFRRSVHVIRDEANRNLGLGLGGRPHAPSAGTKPYALLATLPPLYPEWLGDRTFAEVHCVRFPYIAGDMANGISTTQLVIAMARAGMLGFFGAAGLAIQRVEAAINELQATLDPEGLSWGINLIHSPAEPALEEKVAELYAERGVQRISASAYMSLTPALVRLAIVASAPEELAKKREQALQLLSGGNAPFAQIALLKSIYYADKPMGGNLHLPFLPARGLIAEWGRNCYWPSRN